MIVCSKTIQLRASMLNFMSVMISILEENSARGNKRPSKYKLYLDD